MAGDRFVAHDLAATLGGGGRGPGRRVLGDIAKAIAQHVQDSGGAITRRQPGVVPRDSLTPAVEAVYRSHVFGAGTRRPRQEGSTVIGYGLALLDRLTAPSRAPLRSSPLSSRCSAQLARDARFTRALYRGGSLPASWPEDSLANQAGRFAAHVALPGRRVPGGTTHISAMDTAGNAAALSWSTKARLGHHRPGHRHPHEQHARRVRPAARRPCSGATGTRLTTWWPPWSGIQARRGSSWAVRARCDWAAIM